MRPSPAGNWPATSTRNLTDLRPKPKRNRRAEADRHQTIGNPLRQRITTAARAAGIEPEPYQVTSIEASLIANGEDPTDADLIRDLMRAPWSRKPSRRHWGVGEGGGWAVRSDG